jgi:hypothetical protein
LTAFCFERIHAKGAAHVGLIFPRKGKLLRCEREKIYSFIAFCTFLELSISGTIASGADRELCLQVTSAISNITHTLTLTYSGLRDGHVLLYGDGCYVIPAGNGNAESADCLPLLGSGVLHEDKLEVAVQGIETQGDFGRNIFTSSQTHIWLKLSDLTGTWVAESLTLIENGDPKGHQQFDKGAAKAVRCLPVTDAAKEADKRFKDLVKRLDEH